MLAASVYALGIAILDLCPWCKSLGKVVGPPFCPRCHCDLLAEDPELQEICEAHWKSIRASNRIEKNDRELELLRKIREIKRVDNKIKPKKAINRE